MFEKILGKIKFAIPGLVIYLASCSQPQNYEDTKKIQKIIERVQTQNQNVVEQIEKSQDAVEEKAKQEENFEELIKKANLLTEMGNYEEARKKFLLASKKVDKSESETIDYIKEKLNYLPKPKLTKEKLPKIETDVKGAINDLIEIYDTSIDEILKLYVENKDFTSALEISDRYYISTDEMENAIMKECEKLILNNTSDFNYGAFLLNKNKKEKIEKNLEKYFFQGEEISSFAKNILLESLIKAQANLGEPWIYKAFDIYNLYEEELKNDSNIQEYVEDRIKLNRLQFLNKIKDDFENIQNVEEQGVLRDLIKEDISISNLIKDYNLAKEIKDEELKSSAEKDLEKLIEILAKEKLNFYASVSDFESVEKLLKKLKKELPDANKFENYSNNLEYGTANYSLIYHLWWFGRSLEDLLTLGKLPYGEKPLHEKLGDFLASPINLLSHLGGAANRTAKGIIVEPINAIAGKNAFTYLTSYIFDNLPFGPDWYTVHSLEKNFAFWGGNWPGKGIYDYINEKGFAAIPGLIIQILSDYLIIKYLTDKDSDHSRINEIKRIGGGQEGGDLIRGR